MAGRPRSLRCRLQPNVASQSRLGCMDILQSHSFSDILIQDNDNIFRDHHTAKHGARVGDYRVGKLVLVCFFGQFRRMAQEGYRCHGGTYH